MNDSLSWVHFGDLHVSAEDGYEGLTRFRDAMKVVQQRACPLLDFALLPGDNANHGLREQYSKIVEAMRGLGLPWHVLAGDHDFEPGDLDAMDTLRARRAPYAATVKGYRCLFLDIVSAGDGGPDFRIDQRQRRWIEHELDAADAARERSCVFMHAYPGDLRDDPDGIASLFAAHRVVFVDTGHTHYNELLNDGRVIYGATRSTGQTQEGPLGFSIVTIDDGVPSWRFQEVGGRWPLVQITCPADRRLITEPDSESQVPGSSFAVRVKVFGDCSDVRLSIGGGPEIEMRRLDQDGSRWSAMVEGVEDGLHRVAVHADWEKDVIEVLVRDGGPALKRSAPVALGRDVHAIGAWPEHGIIGSQLGPNKNGKDW